MTYRLTVLTAVFAVFATASIALAAGTHRIDEAGAGASNARQVRIIELPRVVVTARRIAS